MNTHVHSPIDDFTRGEPLIPLRIASEQSSPRRRRAPSAQPGASNGTPHVQLEAVEFNGQIVTSPSAIARFFALRCGAPLTVESGPRSSDGASAQVKDDLPQWLTIEETAKALGVTTGTLSVWRSTGRKDLPWTKTGRRIRYSRQAVLNFIEQSTTRPQPGEHAKEG